MTDRGWPPVTAPVPVMELRGVSYTYQGPPAVAAVKPATLRVHLGEFVAITGHSGAGKSTLLSLLGLLDRPAAGQIEVDGRELATAPERDRAAVRAHLIGFVFQSPQLLGRRTALENVQLGQVYAGQPRRHRRRRALAALARVGLSHRAQSPAAALSSGDRHRVAIARALASRPVLLLADEPGGSFGAAARWGIGDLLGELHRSGMTLVVVTSAPEVAAPATRRLTMSDGWLSEQPAGGSAAGQRLLLSPYHRAGG